MKVGFSFALGSQPFCERQLIFRLLLCGECKFQPSITFEIPFPKILCDAELLVNSLTALFDGDLTLHISELYQYVGLC